MKQGFIVLALIFTLLSGRAIASEEHHTPATGNNTNTAPATEKITAESTETLAVEAIEKKQSEEEYENDIYKSTRDSVDAGKLFNRVLEHLNDTYELHFVTAHVPLPIMFFDATGFHYFFGLHALEHSGEYTIKTRQEIEEEKKAAQFFKVSPFKRVDGKAMGSFWDFSITANVFFMLLASLLAILLAFKAGSRAKTQTVPKGAHNAVEAMVVYVRDEIVYPNMDKKWADRTMPYFLTIFFFIFMMNMLGLVPLTKTPTSAIAVTMALALCTFFLTQVAGIRAMGIVEYLKHFTGGMMDMELPIFMKVVLIAIMTPIEIIGLFTKPFALMVRLFANMTAGHIVIGALIALAMLFQSIIVGFTVSVPFALFIYMLELLVAFIQAYVFTTLSAVFVGMMAHEHLDHKEHGELVY